MLDQSIGYVTLMITLLLAYVYTHMSQRIYGTKAPAFNVILPDDGKEKLYMIGVVVKGFNKETAIANFGQANLYGTYFTLTEVEEFEDEEGRIAFRPKDESVN